MTSRPLPYALPPPKGWTKHFKSSLLHAISLAATALTVARSRAASSCRSAHRLQDELERALTEIALLKEELDSKDARWSRLPSRRRPRYTPIERMRVLQLKAASGWSYEQAARALLVDEQTLRSWMRRLDEGGERELVQTSDPVNKFPDFVRYLVRQLKTLLPTMGKVRIAQTLARAGLHLGATTVGRILKEPPPREPIGIEVEVVTSRTVTASYPGHVWHVDLTTVPTWSGFWVPWMPFSLPQSWPFCWWVAVVVDHFSRAVVGFAVFFGRPMSADFQEMLDRAIRRTGSSPKYVITDKGRQFWCRSFRRWCRRREIRPHFGAVGKHGSIVLVERFIRSLKNECTRQILIPLTHRVIRREIALYVTWYNRHRPSKALGGKTPLEVYGHLPPANSNPRFEPRPLWPTRSPCASPQTAISGARGTKLRLVIGYLEGRRHLPIIGLRKAA
jgi:putative transposase